MKTQSLFHAFHRKGRARDRPAAGDDPRVWRAVVWAATGPIFHYSDTWQLVINTGTSLVTFLMVSLIQSSQVTWAASVVAIERVVGEHEQGIARGRVR